MAQSRNGNRGEVVEKCQLPGWQTMDLEKLLDLRKEMICERDELLSFQKMCENSKDREGARFFKEEASDRMKY